MKKKILLVLLTIALTFGIFGAVAVVASAEATAPEMRIAYCNLSFRDSVCIKYAVKSDVSDVKILLWTSPKAEYTVGTQDGELTKSYNEVISGVTHKVFDYTALSAKQMTDVIYARAYAKVDGVDCYSDVTKYSVLQYAYNKLGKTATASSDADLKELLANMLAYGASAQKYFDYKEDRLATADWYQVKLTQGLLDDGCAFGLYLPGDTVTMTAPEKAENGDLFSHWADQNGNQVATTATFELTVGTANEIYTPMYIYEHVPVVDAAVAPTCNATGLTEGSHCGVCGEVLVAQTIIDALGHSYAPTITPPTATEDGCITYTCSACSDFYTEDIVPVDFEVTADNRNLVGYTGTKHENLVIPSVFENDGIWYRVTAIGNSAFYGCDGLMSVTISDSVTSIGEQAFYSCDGLMSVTIGKSVTNIGKYAFTSYVAEVINKSALVFRGAIGESSYEVINAKEVHSGTTKIVNQNDYVFYTCNGVNYLIGYIGTDTELTLPTNYNGQNYEIDRYAFEDCTNLTSVTIPSSVTSVGSSAFYGCSNLQYNTYDYGYYLGNSTNPYMVFMGTQSTSITSCQIYDTTKIIAGSAFSGCSSLTSIRIPDSVIRIGSNAFNSCSRLTSVHITDISKWCDVSFVDSYSNPLYYAKSLYLNGILVTELVIPQGVTNIGNYTFYGCTSLTKVTIPSSATSIGDYAFYNSTGLTSITIPNSVTNIGDYAFYGCTGLTSITIPKSITNIGDRMFYGCTSLTSITIPSSVTSIGDYAFYGCTSLTSITIPNSVTSIGSDAFYGCTGLTSITIPNSVTSIGSYAFSGCSNLASVTVGTGLKTVGTRAFFQCSKLRSVYITDIGQWCGISFASSDNANPLCYGDLYLNGNIVTELVIPEGVTSIGDYAFAGYNSLTKVTIPSSVTSIGVGVFAECYNLASIVVNANNTFYVSDGNCLIEIESKKLLAGCKNSYIPTNGSVTSIADYAFYGCNYLTSITIPSSVTSIGNYAFAWCRNLTNVTLQNGLTSIGNYAFNYCDKLVSITIPSSVTSIGSSAFRGCDALKNISIPFGVTTIGSYMFEYCTGLTSITLPSSVTSIGNYAFNGCTSLTSITIPSSVTSIGSSVFSGCTSLTSITIPSNVTIIDDRAFYGCTGLTSITIPSNVTSIGNYVFYGCTGLTNITFADTSTWYRTTSLSSWESMEYGQMTSVTSSSTNATYFKSTYSSYYWYKK